jgi:DNA-binding MarR family transcriptional regulator
MYSRKLLGHAYRLELLAALAAAEEDGVVISDLAKRRGVSASVYYPPLEDLGQLGMIARVPESGSRRVRYVAVTSPAWAGVARLASDLAPPPSPGDGGPR